MSKMLSGSDFLMGDNKTPGVRIHPEVKEQLNLIFTKCREFGLDFYDTIIEFCTYDEISELASYGGFPVRYPHWSFGMEYEEMSRGYEHGQFRISEMVVNTNPSVIYCLDSNTLVDNIDVICHALGHNDFFKNNEFFKGTNTDMMAKFAAHGNRIRTYMQRWGRERVTEFIDHVKRLDTLINASKQWRPKPIQKLEFSDSRDVEHPDRRQGTSEYMDDWLNPVDYIDKQKKRISREEAAKELELFKGPEKDIFGYIKDHGQFSPWQQDIVAMLYEEAIYFGPQRLTKVLNEGWASWIDHKMMCCEGLVSAGQKRHDAGIFQYAEHKMRVLGGKWSQNPYKLGFELLLDIEDRWNKGKFGREWDECDDIVAKQKWDKKLGLGKEKVFEVRTYCNDFTLISEYFTPEFCHKMGYYEKGAFRSKKQGYDYEWRITTRDYETIKQKLMLRHSNGGLPDIRLVDPNHQGKNWFLMQHYFDGRSLDDRYARETLISLWYLWRHNIVLSTQNEDKEEIVYLCFGKNPNEDVIVGTREEYEAGKMFGPMR